MENNLLYCKDGDYDENDYVYPDEMLDGESIIAYKIYDSCAFKECLDEKKLKPVITPPCDAQEAVISDVRIKKILIRKKKSRNKKGFWDIRIRYVLTYKIAYFDINKRLIDAKNIKNIFIKTVSLFGSACPRFSIKTDLINSNVDWHEPFEAVPFVMSKAKAVILSSTIPLHNRPVHLPVKIGLIGVITLFRSVNLFVRSEGFMGI